jgi:hypothetical protein
MTKTHNYQEMNREQVKNILKFVDRTQSETIKENIFSQLGYECFFARKLDAWIEQYRGNVQGFLDRVNVQKASKYWEKLEYNEDNTKLILTGKKSRDAHVHLRIARIPPNHYVDIAARTFNKRCLECCLSKK